MYCPFLISAFIFYRNDSCKIEENNTMPGRAEQEESVFSKSSKRKDVNEEADSEPTANNLSEKRYLISDI